MTPEPPDRSAFMLKAPMKSHLAVLVALVSVVAALAGCGSEPSDDPPPPTAAAATDSDSGVLLIHQVQCLCSADNLTTTTIYRDGRAETRFDAGGDIKPVHFQLSDEQVAELDDAFGQVDFMGLPERIERGKRVSVLFDARKIKVTHDGHTVRERTYVRATDDPSEIPEPLRFVLAPIDDLIEGHLDTSIRPTLTSG